MKKITYHLFIECYWGLSLGMQRHKQNRKLSSPVCPLLQERRGLQGTPVLLISVEEQQRGLLCHESLALPLAGWTDLGTLLSLPDSQGNSSVEDSTKQGFLVVENWNVADLEPDCPLSLASLRPFLAHLPTTLSGICPSNNVSF